MKLIVRVDEIPVLQKKLVDVLTYYMDEEMRGQMMINKTFSDNFKKNLPEYIKGILEVKND